MRRIFGILISTIALAGMSLGFWILYNIEVRLMNSVPVPTVVVDKSIEPMKEDGGQYLARARYKYNVNGDFYFGKKVLVYDFNTPVSDYVLAVIDPLQLGAPTVGFYNRYDPQDSFLRKSIPYPPYTLILGSLIFFISGLYLVMTPSGRLAPKQMANGWYRLDSDNANLLQLEKATKAQAIVFSAVSIFSFANYFTHAVKRYGVWEISAACAFALLGSLLWKQALDAKKRAETFDDLHLELESQTLDFDKEYKAKIRLKLRHSTEIISCDLSVRCHKSSVHGLVENETWYKNAVNKKLEAKEEFKLEQSFNLPAQGQSNAYSFLVRVESDRGVQEWIFPIQVNTAISPK